MLIVDNFDGTYKIITPTTERIIDDDTFRVILRTNENPELRFTSIAEYDEETDSYLETWAHNNHRIGASA